MASKQMALVLQKKFGRIGTVLIYAVLEWVLIFLLIIGALLSYLTRKYAEFFGLHPPCLWCNRIDQVFGNQEPGFYTKLVCDHHAREISSLGYCHVHKHLSDVQGMCEDCLLSFAEENKKPSLCAYEGLGVDLASIVDGRSQLGESNRGIHVGNHRGANKDGSHQIVNGENGCELHLGNHLGENGHEFHLGAQVGNQNDGNESQVGNQNGGNEYEFHSGSQMGNHRNKSENGVHGGEENVHESHVISQKLGTKLGELATSDWITDGVCSCCKAPLKRSRLFLQRLIGTPGQEQDGVDLPSVKAVVDLAEDFDREETLMRSVGYDEFILQECSYTPQGDAIVEEEKNHLSWSPLGHIGYTELKDTSDSGSEDSETIAEDGEGFGGQDLLGLDSQVEVISVSLMHGLVHDTISDVENSCLAPAPDLTALENKVKNHKNVCLDISERSVLGFQPPTTPAGEDSVTMKGKLETGFQARCDLPANDSTSPGGSIASSSDGQVTDLISREVEKVCALTELLYKTVEAVPSSEETLIALDHSPEETLIALDQSLEETFTALDQSPEETLIALDQSQEETLIALDQSPEETLIALDQSPEETLIALDEPINKEISLEGSSSECGVALGYGLGELEWNGISDYARPSMISSTELKELPAEAAITKSTSSPKDVLEANNVCFGTEVLKPGLSLEVEGISAQLESAEGAASEEVREDFRREVLNNRSENIEASERKEELNGMGESSFREEEANKPQEEVKLSLGRFSTKELYRIDYLNSHSMAMGMISADEYRPETPRFIEGLQMLHKRVSIDRNDSGFDSLDGSILSEIEGESAVDRLKRQLELERKSLNTLYSELEAERNASAIAANQAMAMITRLQEEKAAMQMEALQYQRMMEEQAEYDQEALQLLNEVLVKREKEIKDLEKEVELYRKRVRYEATKKRNDKRRKTSSEKAGTHLETKRNRHDQRPDNQYGKIKSSSVSSLSEDTDESSSSAQEVEEDIDLQQDNQNAPVDLTMTASGDYEDEQLEDSLDESFVDLEEERLSILERLKGLEEKLHTLADDGESEIGTRQKEHSDISMVHPDKNAQPQEYSEVAIEENKSSYLGTAEDSSIQEKTNGNDTCLPVQDISGMCIDLKEIHWDKETQKRINIGKADPLADSMGNTPRRSGVVTAKRLLPFFEATGFEEESSNTEGSYPAGQSNDWRSFSMIARDNSRVSIEEEVHDLNERLQALEADREFIRHSIKSLRKGDEGMKLLQEIAQHLRELRKVDMRASNFNDSFGHQNAVFISLPEGNGTITMQPHY